MIFSIQKRIILGLIVFLLVFALFVWLVILPLCNKIKSTGQEYLDTQEALVKLDKKEPLFKELEKEYQSKQADLETVRKAFLDKEEAVGFISNLEEIAQKTGNDFEIKSAIPYSPKEQDSYITFQITLRGKFVGLLNFLASLEDSPYPPYRLTEIEALSLKRITDTSLAEGELPAPANLESILNIKIYTQ